MTGFGKHCKEFSGPTKTANISVIRSSIGFQECRNR